MDEELKPVALAIHTGSYEAILAGSGTDGEDGWEGSHVVNGR